MIGLVINNYISGVSDNIDTGKVTIVINEATGIIEEILQGEPAGERTDLEIYTFDEDCTVLPGFIDCHVHLTIFEDDYQLDHLRLSSAAKGLRALKAAQGLLQAGFTTVRSAGDADKYYPSFAVAKSIEKGEFVGPRIVGAGHYISVTGGGGDINFFSADNCPCCVADGVIADGKEQMILAVRKEIKYGSDWIKIKATGAFMSASTGAKDSPENTHMSYEEIRACVEEANRRQVHVMVHAHGSEGIALAANAGCRSIEHASFIDAAGIEACLRNNTWIVPTFTVREYYDEKGSKSGAQSRLIELQDQTRQRCRTSIQQAVAAGVRVALGSDYVGWEPSITAREFKYLHQLGGLTTMGAIQAGTSSAADLLQRPDLGRVTVGSIADLVVVRGNPLKDLSLLETGLCFVMKGGKIVRNDAVRK
eukprot:gene8439-10018_t